MDEHDVSYHYREYTQEPLSEEEIRRVLELLGLGPREVLRRADRVAKELGLTGEEPEGRLVGLMAQHPTLLQRPIGVAGDRAVLGRPPERLLELANEESARPSPPKIGTPPA